MRYQAKDSSFQEVLGEKETHKKGISNKNQSDKLISF